MFNYLYEKFNPYFIAMQKLSYFILLVAIIANSSCSPLRNLILRGGANYELDMVFPDLSPSEPGELLHYEKVHTLSKDEIISKFPKKKGIVHDTFVKYDVDLYRVYYSSKNLGKDMVLSGMVALPLLPRGQSLSHHQYHHGTLLPVDLPLGPVGKDAPSLSDVKSSRGKFQQMEMRVFGMFTASNGYLVSLPDYAGYSISMETEHPYGIGDELATQSVHMIQATRQLAEKMKWGLNGQLYLSGWSEGAYAAVATHKMIESEHPDWDLRMTAALAGPYNFIRFMEYVIDRKKTIFLPLYNWAFYSAFGYADTSTDNEEVWKYKVRNSIDAIATPSNRPKWVYKKKFRKDFTHNPNNEFRQFAITHLNLHEGWKPEAPIHFFTGTADEIVPSFNTMDAYEGLKKAGGEVYYYPLDDESHLTPTQDFVTQMLGIFNQ